MDLYKLRIYEIRDLIINKKIKVVEVVNYFIDRIKKIGLKDNLNAVTCINEDAINDAIKLDELIENHKINFDDYKLLGIPFLVKDNIDLKGHPTTAGSLAFSDNYPNDDCNTIKKLKQSGAICIGKCNMMELANYLGNIPDGYSSYGGQVINAYNANYPVCGSSSGSAVAMAASLAPFTLGSDTCFSVVECACFNGVIGYKPELSNIDNSGVLPITKYADAIGVFTKTIEDLNIVLDVVLNNKIGKTNTKYKLGIDKACLSDLSEEEINKTYELIDKIKDIGFTIEDVNTSSNCELYEIMKRDYAYSLKEYLKGTNSKIRNMKELVEFYHNNEYANKYGCSIIEKAYEYSISNDNLDRLNEILEKRKRERVDYINLLDKYDSIIMLGYNKKVHFFNVPSVSIPFYVNNNDNVPRNFVIYANNDDKLINIANRISSLIEEMPYPREK